MQEAAHLGAEMSFVARTLTTGTLVEMRHVMRGDLFGLARVGTMAAGITLAGLGHVSGKLRLYRSRRVPAVELSTSQSLRLGGAIDNGPDIKYMERRGINGSPDLHQRT